MQVLITADDVRNAKFRAVLFTDGENGMATQSYVCNEYPRLTVLRERTSRREPMRQRLFVDGEEAKSIERAAEMLNRRQEETP